MSLRMPSWVVLLEALLAASAAAAPLQLVGKCATEEEVPGRPPSEGTRSDTVSFGYYTMISGQAYAVAGETWTFDHGGSDPAEGWTSQSRVGHGQPFRRIDAASLVGGDHFAILKRHPDLRVLVDASTPEGLRESYGSDAYASGVVTAKQEWLDSNPGTARKLARALRRTMSWMAAHKPEEIRDRLPGSYRSEDAEVDVRTLRWGLQGPAPDGRMPKGAPETIKRYLDATVESVRASKIDLTSTWTDEFLPDRI